MLNRYSRVSGTQPQENEKNVFRLVNPVYGMAMHIFKVTVFINLAK